VPAGVNCKGHSCSCLQLEPGRQPRGRRGAQWTCGNQPASAVVFGSDNTTNDNLADRQVHAVTLTCCEHQPPVDAWRLQEIQPALSL
jgi:hypothetical protein